MARAGHGQHFVAIHPNWAEKGALSGGQEANSVALVHTSTGDGRELIVFEDEETGYLTQLEVI